MEYICRIYSDINKIIKLTTGGIMCLQLPLFESKNKAEFGWRKYSLYFLKEDRYSPNLIFVHPPSELTEEQIQVINKKWTYCIENDLDKLEFDL